MKGKKVRATSSRTRELSQGNGMTKSRIQKYEEQRGGKPKAAKTIGPGGCSQGLFSNPYRTRHASQQTALAPSLQARSPRRSQGFRLEFGGNNRRIDLA